MNTLPLVHGHGAGGPFAFIVGSVISVEAFLGDVAQVAALLPQRRYLVNLCTDRYKFSVGFGAALVRGQVTLLPPNQTPDLLAQIESDYDRPYALVDDRTSCAPLRTCAFPALDRTRGTQPIPLVDARQTAAIVFTSGSTGRPVANAKTLGALAEGARAELERLPVAGPGLCLVGTVPPQHMYGFESTVLLVMQGGLAMHSGRPFYPADVHAALDSVRRPRALVTTPIHLRALLAEGAALPAVDLVLCATAPLSPQLAADAEARFRSPLVEIYGCTEAGQVATRRTVQSEEWTVLPDLELSKVDECTWVQGPRLNQPVLLNDAIEMRGRDRFLLHGRTSDLVNIAGKRTSIAHLNYQLNSIGGVLDGVFMMPAEPEGTVTRLMALVVAPSLTRERLLAALRERVDAAFLPRPLHFVARLPRNATGKLPAQALAPLLDEAMSRVE